MKEIDARGLACPAPVLRTKAVLQDEKHTGVSVKEPRSPFRAACVSGRVSKSDTLPL